MGFERGSSGGGGGGGPRQEAGRVVNCGALAAANVTVSCKRFRSLCSGLFSVTEGIKPARVCCPFFVVVRENVNTEDISNGRQSDHDDLDYGSRVNADALYTYDTETRNPEQSRG